MNTIHPESPAIRPDARPADATVGRRVPLDSFDRDAWRLAFERAGDGFGAWFPEFEQPGRDGAEPLRAQAGSAPPSRPAASLFATGASVRVPAAPAGAFAERPDDADAAPSLDAVPATPSSLLASTLAVACGCPVIAVESPDGVSAPPGEMASVSPAGVRAPGELRASPALDGQDSSTEASRSAEADRAASSNIAAEREPVRTHVEQVDGGVRVWLGADAHALLALDGLVAQLQDWFSGQGVRLVGLVCNGRPAPIAGRGKVHAFAASGVPDHADTYSADFQILSRTDGFQ